MIHFRAFIAVELPDDIHKMLEKASEELAIPGSNAVRWVASANRHLTLKFLGEITEKDVENISKLLDIKLKSFKPFSIYIGRLGAFPNLLKPKVLWVGFQPSQDLVRLQSAIDDSLMQLKYPKEERLFHPHLTLGRVTDHAKTDDVKEIMRKMKEGKIEVSGEMPVDCIRLFRSDLKPTGPLYSSIHSWFLAQK